jgi:hypothetical protein
MGQEAFEQAGNQLGTWAQTLLNHISSEMPQAVEALSGTSKLPDGCSSRQSHAQRCLRHFAHDLHELCFAFDEMETAIGYAPRFSGHSSSTGSSSSARPARDNGRRG